MNQMFQFYKSFAIGMARKSFSLVSKGIVQGSFVAAYIYANNLNFTTMPSLPKKTSQLVSNRIEPQVAEQLER